MTPGSIYCQYLENEIIFDAKVPGKLRLKNPDMCPIDTKLSLVFVTAALAINMLELSGCENLEKSFDEIRKVWVSGTGLQKFKDMVKQQGGNYDEFVKLSGNFLGELKKEHSANVFVLKAKEKCKIKSIDG